MSQLPDKERLAAFIRENPDQAGKRELARAFGLKGAQRIELKRMLNELADEGVIERRAKKSFAAPGQLPPVAVLIAGAPHAVLARLTEALQRRFLRVHKHMVALERF